MSESGWARLRRYGQALAAPLAVWAVAGAALLWFDAEERYDRAAIQEWLEEARNPDATLPELVASYAREVAGLAGLERDSVEELEALKRAVVRRGDIYQHLCALAEPATKTHPGLLLLFPVVYRLEVRFRADRTDELAAPVEWDSGQLPGSGRYRSASFPVAGGVGTVTIDYQLHAWNKRQRDEQWRGRALLLLLLLGGAASALGVAWGMLAQDRERRREEARRSAQEALDRAEKELLSQRLETQEAQRQALELKSHLYASIGIMAGSYAHNIKNLLVRPNDLLRRCLEHEPPGSETERMLREVQETLALVTDRLQQILHTVRRDPSKPDLKRIDLNEV
ncbi:MAG: hypothetical protein K2W96_04055, partial [Gemmataceae bacterium]|nr:hypothetical protein [Gemmataceae bacterium]